MAALLKAIQNHQSHNQANNEFMRDVLLGLSRPKKTIPSKYFYDETGSELFNRITKHPDYYLTACEIDILTTIRKELSALLEKTTFNLIELGPGEGIKSRLLIDQFIKDRRSFSYCMVDISTQYLEQLAQKINGELPDLNIISINSDYSNGIKCLGETSKEKNFVLFLGSSIGNFDLSTSRCFLQEIRQSLQEGDYMLIGFDLRKDIDVLLRAYNDRDGITRAFNLNLLERVNRELNANFNLNSFEHYGNYNVLDGAMESFIVSRAEQTVHVASLNKTFFFDRFEPIHVESSYKYTLFQIEHLAQTSYFEVVNNFSDSQNYFVNSLWRAKPK
nr:L-histidine N(alpha)-methyltransferase [Legionella jordanis]